MMFFGIFDSRESVAKEFGIDISLLDGVNFICAKYIYESYEGFALVLFEKDGKIFKVEGSHCSCFELDAKGYAGPGSTESQWEPEEISFENLRNWVKNCPTDFDEMLPLVETFVSQRTEKE